MTADLSGGSPTSRPVRAVTVVAAVGGLIAAWIAAGSTGLLGYGLRHALTWLALGVPVVAAWPQWRGSFWRFLFWLAGTAAALAMTTSPLAPINVLAVALLVAVLAVLRPEPDRSALLVTAVAVSVFAVFRMVCTSIPAVWLATDTVGGWLGRLAGAVTGEPLSVGATFAGLDYLVLTAAFCTGWLLRTPPPRRTRIIAVTVAVLSGHLAYLLVLAFAARLLNALPMSPTEQTWPNRTYFGWAGIRTLIPWNFPILAAAVHGCVAAFLVRWSPLRAEPAPAEPGADAAAPRRWSFSPITLIAVLAAILIPVVTTLAPRKPDLAGKKFVVYEKGFLNWLKPEHGEYGHYSVGMYGMLPIYIESLGARCVVSPDLSEEDLRDADALILLFPEDPWQPGQLERIRRFVEGGKTLAVFGEHTTRAKDGSPSRFNEVLKATGTDMWVAFDSATFAVGGWLESYETLAHPTTLGIPDDRNEFGIVIGASMEVGSPAWPFIIGRWGWADPGDPGAGSSLMGNGRYDAGERLGDLVLAAEQSVGKGRVLGFGDTSGMTNVLTMGCHVFTSRLLGYLADGGSGPQAMWRQAVGFLLALALVWSVGRPSSAERTIAVSLVLAVSLAVCTRISYRAAEVLPDGRRQTPNHLAYIDASHIEASSSEGWRNDGTMGLGLTLMRNGFVTLRLREMTAESLQRAGLLVSVAPLRAFSAAERRMIREFVSGGGVFIITVGYDERGPSESLLKDFGFAIGRPEEQREVPEEVKPFGHFKSRYHDTGQYVVYVRFHAAWPVTCEHEDAQVVAYGAGNVPVGLMRGVGEGKIVVIGDSGFAMNKNLEHEDGSPFEGQRENADFWRWFLTFLRHQPLWIPPKPPVPGEKPAPKPTHDHPLQAEPEGAVKNQADRAEGGVAS